MAVPLSLSRKGCASFEEDEPQESFEDLLQEPQESFEDLLQESDKDRPPPLPEITLLRAIPVLVEGSGNLRGHIVIELPSIAQYNK